jgi:5,10-methylene-tetrahydrofolate dehydrogenase/methenyl tetrahydrofolate cyclohydrolase/calcineurin-like phosphoesterase
VLNLLFIADVIGSPGREIVKALLPELRRRYGVGLVVCNGENSAGGFGLTRDSGSDLKAAGVDVLTGGNHLWDRKESLAYLAEEPRLVRPANLPPGTPGLGWGVFMKEADCPFRAADQALEALKDRCRVVLVDFHAETTAEKVALGWHLDGRASAVVGTHTHVQTADQRVLPGGTAFISDAGMTGGFDSVIGMDRAAALRRFLTLMPERLAPAGGDLRLDAVLIEVDPATGRARSIRRLELPWSREAVAGPRLLGGEEPAATLRYAARLEVERMREAGAPPLLALVSTGQDPASQIYLRRKREACAEVGIEVKRVELPAGVETRAVVERVRALGGDPAVTGILVQLPLAPPADQAPVIEAIPPEKDVDGFHPLNVGRLALGLPGLVPATPWGIVQLLRHYRVPLAGAHAVVLGRSNVVGRPLATLLSRPEVNMTVTLCHSASGPAGIELSRQADLLVAAIGKPQTVTADWVKPGATVIDVGIHRLPDASRRQGYRLVGDVDAESVARVAGAMTPVPGGIGPMTVATMLANTVEAARRRAAVVSGGVPEA